MNMEINKFEFTGDLNWLKHGGTWIMKENEELYHVVRYLPENFNIEIDSFDPLEVDSEETQSALKMMGLTIDECSPYQLVEALFIYGYCSGNEQFINMFDEVDEDYLSWADLKDEQVVFKKMSKASRARIRKELVKFAIQANHKWIVDKVGTSIKELLDVKHDDLLWKATGTTCKKILKEAGFVEPLT